MSNLIECKHLRTLEHASVEGRDQWRGIRSFITWSNDAPSYMLSFRKTPFPGFSGDWTPLVTHQRCIFEPQGIKDIALLMLYYQTRREPGKAILTTIGKTFAVPAKADINGLTIEGPDQHSVIGKNNPKTGKPILSGDGIHYWKPVGYGSGIALFPYSVVRLETAYWTNQFRLSDVYGLINHVNDSDLPNFGDAAAGTMLCLPATTHWTWDDELTYVDYHFIWSGPKYTWNQLTEAQRGFFGTFEEPVFTKHADGTYTRIKGKDATVTKYLPGKKLTVSGPKDNEVYTITDAAPEPRTMHEEGDFSALDAMARIPVK